MSEQVVDLVLMSCFLKYNIFGRYFQDTGIISSDKLIYTVPRHELPR